MSAPQSVLQVTLKQTMGTLWPSVVRSGQTYECKVVSPVLRDLSLKRVVFNRPGSQVHVLRRIE